MKKAEAISILATSVRPREAKDRADLIDRQAAIDTIMGQPPEPHYPSWYAAQIEKLPAAQPDHNADIGKKAEKEDCISRQMAIGAICKACSMVEDYHKCDYYPETSVLLCDELVALRALPSVQPDHVADIGKKVSISCGHENDLNFMPSAQPEQHWIPCSERLPERADNVIICYKAGDYTLVSTGRYLYKFEMWYVDVVGDFRDGVTAWMPLPASYKGE